MQINKEAAQITAEQTRLLFNGLRRSIPVSLLLASTLAYVQWPVIEHAVIIGWLGTLLVVNLLRALLAAAYTRVRPLADKAFPWKLGFAAGVAATGAIWGLGAWLLYPQESIINQAFDTLDSVLAERTSAVAEGREAVYQEASESDYASAVAKDMLTASWVKWVIGAGILVGLGLILFFILS